MTTSPASLTTRATRAALLAAGLNTRLSRDIAPSGVPLVPTGPPGPSEAGFDVAGSKAVDVRVVLHRDARARSIFLQIDRSTAPLTGNYVVELDTVVKTYNATSDAPADVDELLTAWAAYLEAEFTDYTATVAPFSGSSDDDPDGIWLKAPTDTGAYATFVLGASTSAPAGADLVIWREVDDVDLVVWTKSAADIPTELALTWQVAQAQGWAPYATFADIGSGYDERLDLAARSAVWPELRNFDETDEAISIVTSGAGVYGLNELAVVVVCPTLQP